MYYLLGVLNLKKYLSFITIGILIIFSFSTIALKTNLQNIEKESDKIEIFELPTIYSDGHCYYCFFIYTMEGIYWL